MSSDKPQQPGQPQPPAELHPQPQSLPAIPVPDQYVAAPQSPSPPDLAQMVSQLLNGSSGGAGGAGVGSALGGLLSMASMASSLLSQANPSHQPNQPLPSHQSAQAPNPASMSQEQNPLASAVGALLGGLGNNRQPEQQQPESVHPQASGLDGLGGLGGLGGLFQMAMGLLGQPQPPNSQPTLGSAPTSGTSWRGPQMPGFTPHGRLPESRLPEPRGSRARDSHYEEDGDVVDRKHAAPGRATRATRVTSRPFVAVWRETDLLNFVISESSFRVPTAVVRQIPALWEAVLLARALEQDRARHPSDHHADRSVGGAVDENKLVLIGDPKLYNTIFTYASGRRDCVTHGDLSKAELAALRSEAIHLGMMQLVEDVDAELDPPIDTDFLRTIDRYVVAICGFARLPVVHDKLMSYVPYEIWFNFIEFRARRHNRTIEDEIRNLVQQILTLDDFKHLVTVKRPSPVPQANRRALTDLYFELAADFFRCIAAQIANRMGRYVFVGPAVHNARHEDNQPNQPHEGPREPQQPQPPPQQQQLPRDQPPSAEGVQNHSYPDVD